MASTPQQRLRPVILLAALVPALACSAGGAAVGQERLPPPQPQPPQVQQESSRRYAGEPLLTLADLEAIALRYNPTLAQASAVIERQRGTWQQSGLYPNPQLGYIRADSNAAVDRSNGFFLSQEIVTARKRQLSRAFEAQEVGRLGWERQAQRFRVLNDLRIRYYEVLGAQQEVDIATHLQALTDEGLRAAEGLYKAQTAAYSDVLQARIQRNRARITLNDARYRYQAAWRRLATIVGQPNLAGVRIEGRLDPELSEIRFEDALDDLFANSPQLRAAEMRLVAARRQLARERAERMPNLTVQTLAEFDRATDSTTVSTLLAAPVPIFNRNQGNIYHASAEIRENAAEIQRVRLVLRDQLAETFRRYQATRYRTAELTDSIVPDAKENLDLVTKGQAQGVFNLFQLLVARQLYSHAELARVSSLTEVHKARVELTGLLLTGGLNPASLGTAIQSQGGPTSQRALLNQMQDQNTQDLLTPALQAASP